MKRILPALLALALLLTLNPALMEEGRLKIVALNFPAYDFARQIAGGKAEISLLLPPGVDAHSFEPTPRDLISLQDADLLIYNGGIGDFWVEGLLESLGEHAPASLMMMGLVDTVTEELVEGMEDAPHAHSPEDSHDHEGHEEDSHEGEGHEEERELDEHVWTAPLNAILIAKGVTDKLVELEPEQKEFFEGNYARFEARMKQLDADFRKMIATSARRTIVLGDRFPMRYFTNAYGLSYYAAFPGCAAQTEPSARTIAFLMDTIKKEEVPAVFYIEFSSQKAARLIAGETGSKPLLLHSAHNVSQQELDAGVTYESIMRENLKNLKEALN